ncbi:MAG TPA: GntR family transcriptional regulator [Burkholderiales bacterium]|nr:GntR family transcriptional regulator [Burkholderiales bacterium]
MPPNDPLSEIFALERPDTLRHKVEKQLRDAILSGRLLPGQRLVERELCEAMGVSRPSLREALRRLEAERLVEIVAHKGPTVAAVSDQEARELYELRVVLESFAARSFAERAPESAVKALRAELKGLREATGSPSTADLLKAKERFYAILLAGCGNSVVADVFRTLLSRINRLRTASLSQPGRLPASLKELDALVKRIAARDAEGAAQAAATHVRNAERAALAMLHEPAPPAAAKAGRSAG